MARTSRAENRRYVLDANALVGLFEDREGIAKKVEQLLRDALLRELPLLMSAVNWEKFSTQSGSIVARSMLTKLKRRCENFQLW